MKICLITQGYPYPGIPQFTFVGELCKAMSDLGVEITVVTTQSIFRPIIRHEQKIPFKQVLHRATGKDILVYTPKVLSVSNLPIIGKYINNFFCSIAIRKVVRNYVDEDVDLFYGHFWVEGFKVLSESIRRNKPIFIATGEVNVTCRPEYRTRLHQFVNQVKGVICVSTKNKEESIAAGLTDGKNCIVIPNAIDSKLFHKMDKMSCRRKLGFSEDGFIVAFTGSFSHRKGSRRVSDAISKLNDKNIKSIFIGKNAEGKDVEPNCPGILFMGQLEHNQIPEYLCASDVFVFPTRMEGCSNAIIEALACGLPVVSSNRNFNLDVLDESCSILIDPDDVDEISHSILILKQNKAVRDKLSRGALAKAETLTITERAKRIVEFIDKNK